MTSIKDALEQIKRTALDAKPEAVPAALAHIVRLCIDADRVLTTPAPGRDELTRIAKEAREAAAALSVERVQGWANPLVTAIVKAADALDELSGNGKPVVNADAPDVVLSASQPERDALRERVALAEMVFKAVKFADMAAGEGIFFGSPKGLDPADILSDYATAIGSDCWDGMPEVARDAILSALPVAPAVDEVGIRADEREKCDRFVGALWTDLFDNDLVKSEGADTFDKWRERIRAGDGER